MICPYCSKGKLNLYQTHDELPYKNRGLTVEIEYALCDNCFEEMILPEQIERNDSRVRELWLNVDNGLI